jgi:hypothetical protein
MKKGITDSINDAVDDIVNGYTGGHGTRILIRALKPNYNVPNKNEINVNMEVDRDFELTVFNWNPNSFNTKNEFGWTDGKMDEFSQPTYIKQFNQGKNEKTLTIEGTIFNEGIDSLSTLEADLISKAPLEAEIKEFEKYANSGAIFLLVEPTVDILGEQFGGKHIGTFYVKSFEYKQSDFIYSNKSQKTVFNIVFKEYLQ